MNTAPERPQTDFAKLEQSALPSVVDTTAASLELAYQREQDARREERFIWVFAMSLLADVIFAPMLGWWFLPIFLLQLVFLIGFAKHCGVDAVVVLLQRIFDRYIDHPLNGNKDGD